MCDPATSGLFSLRLDVTSEGTPCLSCFGQELGYQTRSQYHRHLFKWFCFGWCSCSDRKQDLFSNSILFILNFSFCKPWLKDFVCGGRTSAKLWAQLLAAFELRTTWQMWPWPAWTGSNFQRIKWSWQHQAQQCEISSEWTPTPIQWSSCQLSKRQ